MGAGDGHKPLPSAGLFADEPEGAADGFAISGGGDHGKELALRDEEAQLQSARARASTVQLPKFERSFGAQLSILLRRSLRNQRSIIDKVPYIQIVVMAFVVGALWFQAPMETDALQDRVGAVFFIMVYAGGFNPVFSSLFSFPPERVVLRKERQSGSFRLSAFFFSKVFSDLPVQISYPIIFGTISYWMIGLNPDFGRFLRFLVVLVTTSLVASSFGLLLSAWITNPKVALSVAGTAMLALMLAAGFYVEPAQLPDWISWLRYISFLRFSYDALMINEFEGDVVLRVSPNDTRIWTPPALDSGYIVGAAVLNDEDIDSNVWLNWLWLLIFLGVFQAGAYLCLRRGV